MEWVNCQVPTKEAMWVCTKSHEHPIASDQVVILLEFEARPAYKEGVPPNRMLRIGTSQAGIRTESEFRHKLHLFVEGQLMQTEPWDIATEFYG